MHVIYILLSLLSGFVELGSVVYGLRTFPHQWQPLVLVLAYQISSLVAEMISFRLITIIGSSLVGSFLAFEYGSHLWVGAMSVFLLTIAIQSSRARAKDGSGVSSATKRTFRVVGFCIAGVASHTVLGVVGLCCAALAGATWKLHPITGRRMPVHHEFRATPIAWAMISHQSHFFSYAYPFLIALVVRWGVPISLVGIAFATGWITYIVAERLYGHSRPLRILIWGHAWVALSLVAMAAVETRSVTALLILWFLSGLGGGTVYCFRSINSSLSENAQSDMDISEGIGHVLGSSVGLVLSICCAALAPSLIAATAFALAAPALAATARIPRRAVSEN